MVVLVFKKSPYKFKNRMVGTPEPLTPVEDRVLQEP
jgi:hypothetical protein